MPHSLLRAFLTRLFWGSVTVVVLGLLFGGKLTAITSESWLWLAAFALALFFSASGTLTEAIKTVEAEKKSLLAAQAVVSTERESLAKEKSVGRSAIRERAMGLPTLVAAIDEYHRFVDDDLAQSLVRKSRPARKAAEVVQSEARKRRAAERVATSTKAILDYYESVAPFLADLREELSDSEDAEAQAWIREYSEDERSDLVTRFLTKAEYRALNSVERNQRALDRYWQRSHSTLEVGRMYERYAGYRFEQDGYEVEYHGILKGLEDLGRDLICTKGDKIAVVQCKHWSQHKTIHEKHVFQLFGSMFLCRRDHPGAQMQGVFVTSTSLSPVAREAATFLGIQVREQYPLDRSYPVIKCNVARSGERIYHLPFDQQYDAARIGSVKGEMYCRSVQEAEGAGFRRAFRYRGSDNPATHLSK
jgi:hypothetical protein